VTHPILSVESLAVATREIGEGREVLSAGLKRSVDLFAYPNGKGEDMTPEIVRAVEHAGYRAAFTAEFGAVSPTNPPYEVPRVTAYASSPSELRLQIERFFYFK
jgi:peptidoglycan/xylan/chitin deacetylase (PgdA/CDA1 family)